MHMKTFFLNFDSNFTVPKGQIDNKPALVQVMAWHRTGDKPLPESMDWRIYAALGGDELINDIEFAISSMTVFASALVSLQEEKLKGLRKKGFFSWISF